MGGALLRSIGRTAVGGAVPDYWTATGIPEVSQATAATWTAQASVTLLAADQVPSTNYVGIWSMQAKTEASSAVYTAFNIDGTRDTEYQHVSRQNTAGAWNYPCFGGFRVFSSAVTPADITVSADHRSSSGTHYGKNARMTVLKLGATDLSASNLTEASTASTTLVDFLTLTLTPGDYIVLVSAKVRGSNVAVSASATIVDDGGALIPTLSWSRDLADRLPLVGVFRITVPSGTNTIRIKALTGNVAASTFVDEQHIVALDVSRFSSLDVASLGSSSSGTQATNQSALTHTITAPTGDALVIACGMALGSSTSLSRHVVFDDGGSTALDHGVEPATANTSTCFLYHDVRTMAGGSLTQTISRRSETTGATTTIHSGASIITAGF